jgi:hypothetical protein
MKKHALLASAVLALGGCASTAAPGAPAVRWEPEVLWKGEFAFERIRTGHPDATDPALQIVGVDQGGQVVLCHVGDGERRASVIYDHGTELTGLVVGDVDPAIPGEEIYVGGNGKPDGTIGEGGRRSGTGGAVLQLVPGPGGAKARRIFDGGAYVHSIERVEPQSPGDTPRLLASDYDGVVHLLTPTPGTGPWDDRVLYREPPPKNPDDPKVKDAGFLADASGRPRHEVLLVLKTGRAILLDLDDPSKAHLVHEEPGGLSRVTPDPDGGAWVTGYAGRAMHWVREGDGFRIDVLEQEGVDSGLRGCVPGRFPTPDGGVAPLVIFGFNRLCRTLTPRNGAWDPTTIFRDADRGHTMEAADLVPGNDADELVLGGYSRAITLLTAHRVR